MKKLAIILALSVLGGCAYPPPGPPNYGTRAYGGDPNQWHTVSVTPVAPGTGVQAAAAAGYNTGANNTAGEPVVQSAPSQYAANQPVYVPQPVYVSPPVYVPQPLYVPQPAYSYDPYYWWPPISIGLGFSWFHGDGGHGHGGHGGGWGGHGGGWGGHPGGGRRGH